MKPATRTMRELFELDVTYLVPLYQRPYVWDVEHQWRPLWEDIEIILEHHLDGSGDGLSHFLGAIVLEQELHAPGEIPRFTVIDGQQRLTTLQLLLAAAATVAAEAGAEREAALLRRLTKNDELMAEGIDVFKVWPTNANQAAFKAVMREGGPPADREDDPNNRIDEAHAFFTAAIREWLHGEDLATPEQRIQTLWVVLTDLLKVVSITLEPGDNAQIIFETLNARGTPLLALDLVKNAVFHAAARQGLDVDSIYHEQWEPELDQPYWRQERRQGRWYRPRADLFLMHWLTMKLQEIVPASELFPRFRQRILDAPEAPLADELIREVRRDAQIMRSFESQPPESYEAVFFERLDLLDTSVMMPLVLLLFRDRRITDERRRRALHILESWLVRRTLMRLTAKNYNVQVPTMLARVAADPEHADEALLGYFYERWSGSEVVRWPDDRELKSYLTTRPLYGWVAQKRIVLVLAAVEQSLYGPKVDIPDVPKTLSLEHLMPQSWEEHWPIPTDGDPVELRERRGEYVHRLGNLTLTAAPLNTALSNSAWERKRKKLNEHTRLLINVELVEKYEADFNEEAIDERGVLLAARICTLWPGPHAWVGDREEEPPAESRAYALAVEPTVLEEAESSEEQDEGLEADIHAFADLLRLAAPGGTVDVIHERSGGTRARLDLGSTTSVKQAYLDADLPNELPLRLYPADTLEQARVFYHDLARVRAFSRCGTKGGRSSRTSTSGS